MLTSYNWEESRAKLQHYKRRSPEKSSLYRLVYNEHERLEQSWEERFQPEYGVLRDEVKQTLEEYLNCGLVCHGAARLLCDTCKYSTLLSFSCKKRGVCPSCGAKRAVKFAEHVYEEILLPVEHRHIVFTIPKRLRVYFRYDRKLLSILFVSAWQSVSKYLGAKTGLVLTAQTAGEALNYHPHLHGIITNGEVTEAGKVEPFKAIDLKHLNREFCSRVLGKLKVRKLISKEHQEQIRSQEHSGFSVWVGEPFNDENSDKFVARYIERGPVSLERLRVKGARVIYSTKAGEVHEYKPLEFLALLTSHIPQPYESITRYYGEYSCRKRGAKKKQAKAQQDLVQQEAFTEQEPKKRASITWAQCIKKIYEVDPLECPRCKEQMRIVAFLQDPVEIKKIMDSLGIPDYTAPPPLAKEYIQPESDYIPDYENCF